MDGDQRREEILFILKNTKIPVSGTELAKLTKVSRQVIVQDIALIRAINKNILSTNKGYLIFSDSDKKDKIRKTLKLRHNDSQMEDELYTIVDIGGRILDVVVEHEIYGQIAVDLIINSRADVDAFMEKVRRFKTKPLNELTDGLHFHTIETDTAEIMSKIEQALIKKGYLTL